MNKADWTKFLSSKAETYLTCAKWSDFALALKGISCETF